MSMETAAAKNRIPPDVLDNVAAALRVLAHPHRLRIVELLEGSDLSVGQLAAELGIPQAACSQHLNRMRAYGLLRARREGKEVYYQVSHPHALNVLACIRKHMD
jgi:DNA-binding transcriptional ArsR family regulator